MNSLERFDRRGSRGIALIFLLSMIVLLTVLVILILTRATLNRQISSSSSGEQKADQLAQAGLQNVLNDLRQEIAAGSSTRHATYITTYNSVSVSLPSTSYQSAKYASTNVYIPTSNLTIVPAFAGYAATATSDPFPNLLKRSAYTTNFFTNPTPPVYNTTTYPPSKVASNLNTGSPSSLDGRSISSARWNKPMLMDPTQLTSHFTAPDWVLVTRSGPQAFGTWSATLKDSTNPTNYVVGRYAYMIYDEGGLLDATTAGCNSANSAGNAIGLATDFDKSSKRGRLGQADLTAIPGLTQSDIDKLVLWRNATTAATASNPAQSYFSYLFHGSFSSGTFQYNITAPVDPTSAFMTALNGDQTFLSRQDLLNFFDFTFGTGATEDTALPYLGTFSRELNAPSYCPPDPNPINSNTVPGAPAPVVAKQYKYADNAELTTLPGTGSPNPNRNFPSVKFANNGTLPDGTVVTAGEPLVRRRFPLSRLQLIANKIANPTDTSNDTAIHNYFGLTYDSSTSTSDPTAGKWTYTSPDSTSVATTIKTLDQVAQLNPPREPDFFELLQAGILNGSLGKTAGTDLNGASTSGSETVVYDSRADYQVIQIGANIIDQSGADPTPTTIVYGGTDTASVPDFYDFYGIENLPYISKINQVMYRQYVSGGQYAPVSQGGYGNPYATPTNPLPGGPWYRPNVSAWLQFELWNPHQNPQAGPSLPLRIYAVGTVGAIAFNTNSNNGGTAFNPWYGNPNPGQLAVAYGWKTFDNTETISLPSTVAASAYTQADYFREPVVLTSGLGTVVSNAADHLHEGPSSNPYCNSSGWDFIGLKTGDAFAPDYNAEDPGNGNNYAYGTTDSAMGPTYAGIAGGAGGVTFYLQCEYPAGSGNWKTIQKIKNCVVTPDTNTTLPSCWLKCLQEDHSWMTPAESQTSAQASDHTVSPKSAYRMLPDPRTDRFGVFESYREDPLQPTNNPSLPELAGPSYDETVLPSILGNVTRGMFGYYWDNGRMRIPSTWSYNSLFTSIAKPYTYNGWFDGVAVLYEGQYYYGQQVPDGDWAGLLNFNSKNLNSQISNGPNHPTTFPFANYYYADNDGIIRGGDGYYADGNDEDSNGYLDGFPAYMGSAGTLRPERPVILSRPFRSPGELGYVHRGEPWKSLDFFTPDSGDAGLLDLFCLDDEDVVAGTVDLNTRQAPVLQAILQGANKNELATTTSDPNATSSQDQNNVDPILSTGSSGDAAGLASLLVQERLGSTSTSGPLANRSELVTRFLAQNTANTAYTEFPLNKSRREAVVRPLAAVGNTRTWNLLIDIIAQSGHYPPNATGLSQFVIEGEKRYWWHVAIDRFTGQIVDSQLEPVYE